MRPILDLKGTTDMHGRTLEVTEVAIADEVAAAAELAMGKSTGIAAALVRGVAYEPGIGRASELVRNPSRRHVPVEPGTGRVVSGEW